MFVKVLESNFDYTFTMYHFSSTEKNKNKNDTNNSISKDNSSSLYRARSKIIDYAKNNEFNFFFTQTFDDRKVDINESELLCKQLRKFFNNFKTRYDNEFKFIIISEYGKKTNRLHFHGLLYIKNTSVLERATSKKYGTYYRFKKLLDRFGAGQLRKINDYNIKCANYISKYITKSSNDNFASNYWCSRGLKTSKTICNFEVLKIYQDINIDNWKVSILDLLPYILKLGKVFENNYCSIVRLSRDDYSKVLSLYLNDKNPFLNVPSLC